MTLYFIYAPGCSACAAAEPVVEEVMQKRPSFTLIRRNALHDPNVLGWVPKGTPGYALVNRGQLIGHREGAMSKGDLNRWLDGTLKAAA
jgi:hypothetical protein